MFLPKTSPLSHLGYPSAIELEDLGSYSNARYSRRTEGIFRKHADKIRVRYRRLLTRGDQYQSPYDAPVGYLKRATYVLTRHFKAHGQVDVIEAAAYQDGTPRGPKVKDNPFHWALVAIFPNDELKATSSDDGAMFPQTRNRIARQLLYADRHNVPPEYLVGFLYQSGNPEVITEKLKTGESEPWFEVGDRPS